MESRNERLSLECSISAAREGSSFLPLVFSLSPPSSMALGWVTTNQGGEGNAEDLTSQLCPGKASSSFFSMCLTCRIRGGWHEEDRKMKGEGGGGGGELETACLDVTRTRWGGERERDR